MRRKSYKGFYTNKTIKNVGQMNDTNNYNDIAIGKILHKDAYKYMVTHKYFNLEKSRSICGYCHKKCTISEPANDWYDYKTKSKKKRKGNHKILQKNFNYELQYI